MQTPSPALTKFQTLDNETWARELKTARSTVNTIKSLIHMKLNLHTPLSYEKTKTEHEETIYVVKTPSLITIGTLEEGIDGFFYYFPIMPNGAGRAEVLHDIAHKLDAINEAWKQRLNETCSQLDQAKVVVK